MAEPAPSPPKPRRRRDPLSILGMAAVAAAAAFTSYSGLYGLAHLAGWPGKLAMMLPVTVDAYAMTATRVWLSPAQLTKKARSWARGNAIGAISTSVFGNALYHAAAAHVLTVTWPVVVALSAIPPVALGLTVHLWHVADDHEPEPDTRPSPGPAIAEPEAVRAAYPILGDASALDGPAKRASGKNPGALGARSPSALAAAQSSALGRKPGAPDGTTSAPGPADPSALRPRPDRPSSTHEGAKPPAPHASQSPARPRSREERAEQLLHTAQMLDLASVMRGDGPMSARRLAREMHISQDTARALIKEMRQRMESIGPSSSDIEDTDPRTTNAPRAAVGVHSGPGTAHTSSAPQYPTAGAPEPLAGSASADAEPAPRLAKPSAPGGALPAQRTEPIAHANGVSVEQP